MGWVHASERLSLLHLGKASRGNAKVKTGIGKSDLPGLQGGPRKRDLVIYDKVRASRLYPDRFENHLGIDATQEPSQVRRKGNDSHTEQFDRNAIAREQRWFGFACPPVHPPGCNDQQR